MFMTLMTQGILPVISWKPGPLFLWRAHLHTISPRKAADGKFIPARILKGMDMPAKLIDGASLPGDDGMTKCAM